MLTCLRVRNFAIIDELEVELGHGLNVVTGETGAGKSILVDALSLVLGARGRPEVVRSGMRSAEVEALFDVEPGSELAARVEAAGVEHGGELVVRRVVRASGRTRAYVNGRLTTAAQLADIAAGLADISSQHEHHSLVEPARHLGYLDAFGGLDAMRAEVGVAHHQLTRAAAALADLAQRSRDRVEREDLLRYQIGEIDTVEPRVGEDDELREELSRLRNAEQLARAAGSAEDALYANDGALCEVLGRIAADVHEAAAIDGRLGPLATQLDDARAQLEDAARELGSYARDVTFDGHRLSEVEDRLDALKRLQRKYGGSLASVLARRDEAATELQELSRHEDRLEELSRERDRAFDTARTIAAKLSAKRHEAAARLGTAISEQLASLGMGDARVQVEVAPLEGSDAELSIGGARLSSTGIDRAEMMISPNRGETARPLRKIASGGELSRSMLAIKRVLAGLRPAGLYVFDEVDAGVGGAVAEVIGKKLEDVARHHQVLCITHLPQIAVYADTHFRVRKDVVGDRTVSEIDELTDKQRKEEVARMLGGLQITPKTRAAAAEMLTRARQ